jgi:coproporphyrinogen III oxidase
MRVAAGGSEPMRPGHMSKNQIWMPKTRIAVGIVFIGTLIYSMVSGISRLVSVVS